MNNMQLTIPQESIKKICIIWFGLIGDTLIREPTLANLKAAYPDTEITIIVDPACRDLFRHHPAVDHIIAFKRGKGANLNFLWRAWCLSRYLNKQRFDLAVNFYGGGFSLRLMHKLNTPYRLGFEGRKQAWVEKHHVYTHQAPKARRNMHWGQAFSTLLKPLGIPELHYAKPPCFYLNESTISAATQATLTHLKTTPFVLFNLTAGGSEKIWAMEKFMAIANWLQEKYRYHIVLIYSPGHDELMQNAFATIHNKSLATCLPLLPLDELAFIMSKAAFIVTGDTGPMNLAFSVRCPGLVIFTRTPPEYFIPDKVITEHCFHPDPNDVREGIHYGLDTINIDEVKDAAKRLIKRLPKSHT